jgi:Uma2 family endonuclease
MNWSEAEYLAMEAESSIKHEFVDGEVFAMAGAKPAHNQLAAAAMVALGLLVRGGRCRVFNSDQRIYVPATGLCTYADGGVVCGRWELHTDGMCLRNPVLLFEVLSPSTREYDQGAKLEHYRQISSLRHVLRFDEPERRVEHHRRGDDGVWSKAELRAGSVDLTDLGGSLVLDEVYLEQAL